MDSNEPAAAKKYLPFLNGIYTVAPGLVQTTKIESWYDRLVYQVDDDYVRYISNKQNCRRESLAKYYIEYELPGGTAALINQYIVSQICTEHPAIFEHTPHGGHHSLINRISQEEITWEADWLTVSGSRYPTLFDSLCSQVQEDLAICLLGKDTNHLAALHLCAPNYWAPEYKIGKDFSSIHEIVPGMEKMRPHVNDMLRSIVGKGPFTRFAWGITSDDRLNHHPEPPPGADRTSWYGRIFEQESQELFIRSERQTMVGFPEINGFLFMIRTYFYPVSGLDRNERSMLASAISSMTAASLEYKGLTGKVDRIRELLLSQGE